MSEMIEAKHPEYKGIGVADERAIESQSAHQVMLVEIRTEVIHRPPEILPRALLLGNGMGALLLRVIVIMSFSHRHMLVYLCHLQSSLSDKGDFLVCAESVGHVCEEAPQIPPG